MGPAPEVEVRAGRRGGDRHGGAAARRAPTRWSWSSTPRRRLPELIEVLRPVAPGEGLVRADEDAAAGRRAAPRRPAAARSRPRDAGGRRRHRRCAVHARPRVAIVSTGDELVPPTRRRSAPGQVRDATAPALAALVREAGGVPVFARHRARRPRRRWPHACAAPLAASRRRGRLGGLLGRRARRDRRGGRRARRAGHLVPRPRAQARASPRSWPSAAACR